MATPVNRLMNCRWATLVLYSCLSLIAVLCVFSAVICYRAGLTTVFAIGLSFIPVSFLLVCFVFLIRERKDDIGFVFMLIAIPASLGFCFFLLPDQVPDEIWHIYRVLNFTGNGNGEMVVPNSLTYLETPRDYRSLYFALNSVPDWQNSHVVERDMSSYLSHLYMVPGIVAMIGKAVNFNPYVVVYLARLANVLIFLVAAYWILKIIPLGKTVTLIYLLNPMLIQQEASCSADAFLNAISLLFLAYFLKLLFQSKISKKEIVILVFMLVMTCLSKFAYAPLALLLVLFVPRLSKAALRRALYVSIFLIIISVITFVVVFYQGQAYKDTLDLVKSPFELIVVLFRTFFFMGPFWVESFAGYNLGALSINAWAPCFWAYLVLLVLAIFYNLGEDHFLNKKRKLFIVLLVATMIVLIAIAFREWTLNVDGRSDILLGVQGRYFIPLLLLPLLCLINPSLTIRRPNCLYKYSFVLVMIFAFDMAFVVRYFW